MGRKSPTAQYFHHQGNPPPLPPFAIILLLLPSTAMSHFTIYHNLLPNIIYPHPSPITSHHHYLPSSFTHHLPPPSSTLILHPSLPTTTIMTNKNYHLLFLPSISHHLSSTINLCDKSAFTTNIHHHTLSLTTTNIYFSQEIFTMYLLNTTRRPRHWRYRHETPKDPLLKKPMAQEGR